MTASPARLMLVEDDVLVALELTARLGQMGYLVVAHATTAPEALDCVRDTAPDLVLMDIRLGQGLDGVDAAETIAHRFNVPVVFMTAHSDDATRRRAEEARPLGYVVKPVRDRDLRSAIDAALSKRRSTIG